MLECALSRRVTERDIVEHDLASRAPDRDRIRLLLDLRLRLEQLERMAKADELLLELAHRRSDLLERLVNRRDIGHHDQELAGREPTLKHLPASDSEHERGAGGRQGVHTERE